MTIHRSKTKKNRPVLKASKDSGGICKEGEKMSVGGIQLKKPIIIYTKPPEIIHAEAKHFMSLVQKLTGKSSNVGDPKIPVSSDDDGPDRPASSSFLFQPSVFGPIGGDCLVPSKSDDFYAFYHPDDVDGVDLFLPYF